MLDSLPTKKSLACLSIVKVRPGFLKLASQRSLAALLITLESALAAIVLWNLSQKNYPSAAFFTIVGVVAEMNRRQMTKSYLIIQDKTVIYKSTEDAPVILSQHQIKLEIYSYVTVESNDNRYSVKVSFIHDAIPDILIREDGHLFCDEKKEFMRAELLLDKIKRSVTIDCV